MFRGLEWDGIWLREHKNTLWDLTSRLCRTPAMFLLMDLCKAAWNANASDPRKNTHLDAWLGKTKAVRFAGDKVEETNHNNPTKGDPGSGPGGSGDTTRVPCAVCGAGGYG